MDDKVVVFKPRSEQTAEDNLQGFITLARDALTAFGSELVFDADGLAPIKPDTCTPLN